MAANQKIVIPDLGDFDQVEVIEVLVSKGDSIEKDDSLVVLETDKASMEVPAEFSGTIESLDISVGDKVSAGDVIGSISTADNGESNKAEQKQSNNQESPAPAQSAAQKAPQTNNAPEDAVDLVVIGAGPAGYSAAFRAADLGLSVTLVERYATLGGV